MMRLRFQILIMGLILVIVAPSPAQADHGGPHEGTTPTSRLNASLRLSLAKGEKAPAFRLVNQEGRSIALDELKGKPLFLSFMDTNCKKRCPPVLESRAILEKKYEASLGKEIVFLLVTLDALNNSPEILKTSRTSGEQPKNLHLLTGSNLDVRKVLSRYKINVIRDPDSGEVLWHTALGYAIDREGIIRDVILFNR